MMNTPHENLLCRYQYDPLDRLAGQDNIQRFYLKTRLVAEVDGAITRSLFLHEMTVLAEHTRGNGKVVPTLLATDQQASVVGAVSPSQHAMFAYSPYGNHDLQAGMFSLLGFTGERRDAVTGHYLLGNGYRAFNPVLMRFNSPDSLSPFGKGGPNSYAYCQGDPINARDPTGHGLIKGIANLLGLRTPRRGMAASASREGLDSAGNVAGHNVMQPAAAQASRAQPPGHAVPTSSAVSHQPPRGSNLFNDSRRADSELAALRDHRARVHDNIQIYERGGHQVPDSWYNTRNGLDKKINKLELPPSYDSVTAPPSYSEAIPDFSPKTIRQDL